MAKGCDLDLRDRPDRRSPDDRRLLDRPCLDRRRYRRRLGLGLGLLAALGLAYPELAAKLPQRSHEIVEVIASDFRIGPALDQDVESIISDAAVRYGVRPDLVRAVIQVESGFNPLAVSRVGAQGLMQLMPRTAADLGVRDPLDARQNIFGGAKYLGMLLDRFNGNVALAVAGYNAGPRAVARFNKKIPPFRETRDYVHRVREAQHDWLRENGQGELSAFDVHPALFYVSPPPKPRIRRVRVTRRASEPVRKVHTAHARVARPHQRIAQARTATRLITRRALRARRGRFTRV